MCLKVGFPSNDAEICQNKILQKLIELRGIVLLLFRNNTDFSE